MSASCLLQGRVLGELQTRPTKTGGQVTFFKMQVINGATKELWSISTFSDTVREELSGLSDGDAVSVVGTLVVELFEWKGVQRIGLRLTADRALALKPKPAKPKASRARQSHEKAPSGGGGAIASKSWASPAPQTGGAAPLDDSIPFAAEWR
jgi:hypothetical protein